jgi:hypothetical protein
MDGIAIATETLEALLENEIKWYHGDGLGGKSYFLQDNHKQTFAVMAVIKPFLPQDYPIIRPDVMAHIHEGFVVIDADNTDKPLYERLERVGIPREKIILAYLGETVPNTPHDELLFPHTEKSNE